MFVWLSIFFSALYFFLSVNHSKFIWFKFNSLAWCLYWEVARRECSRLINGFTRWIACVFECARELERDRPIEKERDHESILLKIDGHEAFCNFGILWFILGKKHCISFDSAHCHSFSTGLFHHVFLLVFPR